MEGGEGDLGGDDIEEGGNGEGYREGVGVGEEDEGKGRYGDGVGDRWERVMGCVKD